MTEQKFFTPLKVGLLAVAAAYFLFTLHAMFTLSWIGEWEPLHEPFRTVIFVEDICATACLAFRFAAGIIALSAVIVYLAKGALSKSAVYRAVRLVLVFEGIYWLGLIATAGYSVQEFVMLLIRQGSAESLLNSLFTGVIPTVMEAVVLPIVLFILAAKLKPDKPLKTPIKWGFIVGVIALVVFWLTNTANWLGVLATKGISYLWMETTLVNGVQTVIYHPEHMVSFVTTSLLAVLAIYAGYVAKKSRHAESLSDLNWGELGIIFTLLGLYFLWNYLSWVMLAGDTWNYWYAWFLGHNMDLWMLALPLLGLPMLFQKKAVPQSAVDGQQTAT
jgi:hypothetical protein